MNSIPKLLLSAIIAAIMLTACGTNRNIVNFFEGITGGNVESYIQGGLYYSNVPIVYYDKRTDAGKILKAVKEYGSDIVHKYSLYTPYILMHLQIKPTVKPLPTIKKN